MTTKFGLPLGFCLLSLGSCRPVEPVIRPDRGRITQVSVIDTLMIGRYDGVMPIPELLLHGDGLRPHLVRVQHIGEVLIPQLRGDLTRTRARRCGPIRKCPTA